MQAATTQAASASKSQSSTPTPRMKAKAESICSRLHAKLAATTIDFETPASTKAFFTKRAALEHHTLTELSALTPPPAIAPAWQQLLVSRGKILQIFEALGPAAANREQLAARELELSKLQRQIDTLAKATGIKACTG